MKAHYPVSKLIRAVSLILLGGVLMCSLSACSLKSREDIEGYFADFRSLYPTTDLMSFFNKSGGLTDNPDDKGTWIISSWHKSKVNGPLHAEGMVLYFNKNLNKAKGSYDITTYKDTNDSNPNEIRYPVTYDENGIHLETEVEDEQLRNKILNFKFCIEYMDFNEEYLYRLKEENKGYNYNVPSFHIKYALKKDDPNLNNFTQLYPDFTLGNNPTIEFYGSNESSWKTYSQRTFTIYCNEKQYIDERISFSNSDE